MRFFICILGRRIGESWLARHHLSGLARPCNRARRFRTSVVWGRGIVDGLTRPNLRTTRQPKVPNWRNGLPFIAFMFCIAISLPFKFTSQAWQLGNLLLVPKKIATRVSLQPKRHPKVNTDICVRIGAIADVEELRRYWTPSDMRKILVINIRNIQQHAEWRVTSVDRKRIRQGNRTRRYKEALNFCELRNKPIIINSSFMHLPNVYSLSSSVSTTKISINSVQETWHTVTKLMEEATRCRTFHPHCLVSPYKTRDKRII